VQELGQALNQCRQLEVALELAVHLPRTETSDLETLRDVLIGGGVTAVGGASDREAGARLKRVLVLRDGEAAMGRQSMEWARGVLGGLGVPIGAGSDCNFCELNREQALGHLAVEESDFLFWSINPQVHAVDAWSVMETLEAQGATVRTARSFAGDRPLAVSPVTLKQRFNPVATGPEPALAPGELPSQVDARQMSLFAAAWTVGSLSVLAEAGVASITYFETVGWRGIMAREENGPWNARFPAEPGMIYPLYLVLSALARFEKWQAIASDDSRRVIGMGLRGTGGRRRLLLANLTGHPVETLVQGLTGEWRLRRLDVGNTRRAFHDPGLFWAMPGEPLPEKGPGRSLRIGGYGVVVADGSATQEATDPIP
jgi:D-apionolactonase